MESEGKRLSLFGLFQAAEDTIEGFAKIYGEEVEGNLVLLRKLNLIRRKRT